MVALRRNPRGENEIQPTNLLGMKSISSYICMCSPNFIHNLLSDHNKLPK